MSSSRRRSRGARCGRTAAAGALALAVLGGCASGGTADVTVPADGAGSDLPALAGLWHLAADGEPDDAVLSLSGGELTVVRPCVSLDGTWAARGGLFLADMPDEHNRVVPHEDCPQEPEVPIPGWLASATRYSADGGGWRLLDADGDAVATLGPGATYPEGAPRNRSYWERGGGGYGPPGRDERSRLNTTPTAPLPAGLRAATASELVGRWEPDSWTSVRCDRPYLNLRADGTWSGHDNSAAVNGRWVAGEDGLALGTAVAYDENCGTQEGIPEPAPEESAVGGWMLRLTRFGFRGEELVLFDPDGRQLASLTRAQPPAAADDVDNDGLSDSDGDADVQRPQEPQPPPDPRREGVPVRGGMTYLVGTDDHQFMLAPFGVAPDPSRLAYTRVLEIDQASNSGVIVTGCAIGDVWLTVRVRDSAPAPLATAMDGWEVGAEETMRISSPLNYVELGGGAGEIFTPKEPGLHRVRVLAKGRALQYDGVCEKPVEYYELTIWPVDRREPRVRLGDDGV